MSPTLPGVGDTQWELGVLSEVPDELRTTRFIAFDRDDAMNYVEKHLKPAGFIEYLRPVKD